MFHRCLALTNTETQNHTQNYTLCRTVRIRKCWSHSHIDAKVSTKKCYQIYLAKLWLLPNNSEPLYFMRKENWSYNFQYNQLCITLLIYFLSISKCQYVMHKYFLITMLLHLLIWCEYYNFLVLMHATLHNSI